MILDKLLEETYAVVDDIFRVFENVREMFRSWDKTKHAPFIQEVMKLQRLEERLLQLGYTDEFVKLLLKAVKESVFTQTEIKQYMGNWYI